MAPTGTKSLIHRLFSLFLHAVLKLQQQIFWQNFNSSDPEVQVHTTEHHVLRGCHGHGRDDHDIPVPLRRRRFGFWKRFRSFLRSWRTWWRAPCPQAPTATSQHLNFHNGIDSDAGHPRNEVNWHIYNILRKFCIRTDWDKTCSLKSILEGISIKEISFYRIAFWKILLL